MTAIKEVIVDLFKLACEDPLFFIFAVMFPTLFLSKKPGTKKSAAPARALNDEGYRRAKNAPKQVENKV